MKIGLSRLIGDMGWEKVKKKRKKENVTFHPSAE
jgi:hypothetical protein